MVGHTSPCPPRSLTRDAGQLTANAFSQTLVPDTKQKTGPCLPPAAVGMASSRAGPKPPVTFVPAAPPSTRRPSTPAENEPPETLIRPQ